MRTLTRSCLLLVLLTPAYDNRFIFQYEKQQSEQLDDLPIKLYLAIGERESRPGRDMVGDVRGMAHTLEQRSYDNLDLLVAVLPDENHDSVFPSGLSTGLRFVFGTL